MHSREESQDIVISMEAGKHALLETFYSVARYLPTRNVLYALNILAKVSQMKSSRSMAMAVVSASNGGAAPSLRELLPR
jgi:hypothetical protein